MKVRSKVIEDCRVVDDCSSENISDILSEVGARMETFFRNGRWEGLDFSQHDMSKVRFDGAYVVECTFRKGDLTDECISGARVFRGNSFVEYADHLASRAAVEKDGSSKYKVSAQDLVTLIQSYNRKSNTALIQAAYNYGHEVHRGQKRQSGEDYFTHPVAVAAILAEQNLDDATIITALLHDTLDSTRSTVIDLENRFGKEIAQLVQGVNDLTQLRLSSRETKQAENFRKLFMAMSKDVRVILVKLSDRLHNMRTIKHLPHVKQTKKARETLDIYAPLAGRMGLQWMRDELEDLSFRVLNPDGRQSIMRRFIRLQNETGDVVQTITSEIRRELDACGIEAEVYGRARKPYSIWRKMEEKQIGFSRLSDIYGFRVITQNEDDCYRVLGVIQQRWKAVPGLFKDYISQPKSNGYRSIHTTVSWRKGTRVEVQIRTRQMHEVAEAGVAAQWSYRDGFKVENAFAVDPAKWLSSISDQLESTEHHAEFLEHVRIENHSGQVFCFSPKGEVVKLAKGATVLDYAYAIHTKVGHGCVGAKVGGSRVPIWTRLRNGESVEIITAEGQEPQAEWLDIVTSGRAKKAIRRRLRDRKEKRLIEFGSELTRVSLERYGRPLSEKILDMMIKRSSFSDRNELLKRIGLGEISVSDLVNDMFGDSQGQRESCIEEGSSITGLPQRMTHEFSHCCLPVPGERIVGIQAHDLSIVSIHAIDCEQLKYMSGDSFVWHDLHWVNGEHPAAFLSDLRMVLTTHINPLILIGKCAEESSCYVQSLSAEERKNDCLIIHGAFLVSSLAQLIRLKLALESQPEVLSVHRFRSIGAELKPPE